MTIYLSLLVALLGLILYAIAGGKASEVGRIAFWTGLLAFLLQYSGRIVTPLR